MQDMFRTQPNRRTSVNVVQVVAGLLVVCTETSMFVKELVPLAQSLIATLRSLVTYCPGNQELLVSLNVGAIVNKIFAFDFREAEAKVSNRDHVCVPCEHHFFRDLSPAAVADMQQAAAHLICDSVGSLSDPRIIALLTASLNGAKQRKSPMQPPGPRCSGHTKYGRN